MGTDHVNKVLQKVESTKINSNTKSAPHRIFLRGGPLKPQPNQLHTQGDF